MNSLRAFFKDPRTQAALQSLWVTATAVAAFLYTDAQQNGAAGSPAALLAYCESHWWGAVTALVITPAIRAIQAHKELTNP